MDEARSKYDRFIQYIKDHCPNKSLLMSVYLDAPMELFLSKLKEHESRETNQLLHEVLKKNDIDASEISDDSFMKLTRYIEYFKTIAQHL